MASYVLDTSAVLTILNDESGVDIVLGILEEARDKEIDVYLPFMALMELEYLSLRRHSEEETRLILNLVEAWPVNLEYPTLTWLHEAAKVKALGVISVADAWICSLARLLDVELVHKDPEYDEVPGLKVIKLPYDSGE
ncbi:MAG: tRNA(fMet)-specific endonuclease VapC [Chloroflexi bacterium]|nr:tRNA(fMet)-specific endonuclease VapC [Chloroflexota bacterium]